MDEFLANVGVQAMKYAIRSGVSLTSSYALRQCSRLLKTVEDENLYAELKSLQKLLDSKIKVISPAIDLIEFKSGRGNIFLESAAPLAKSLQQRIASLGRRIELAITREGCHVDLRSTSFTKKNGNLGTLQQVIVDMKCLLEQIDREIPLLQLAISASGESLSTSLPAGISPSRLLQASTLLIIGDTQHAQDPEQPVQIGPIFTLSVYMLFLSHTSIKQPAQHDSNTLDYGLPASAQTRAYGLRDGDRKPLWQEVMHKARVRLCRSACNMDFRETMNGKDTSETSGSTRNREYSYFLEFIEDFVDGRVHDGIDTSQPYVGVLNVGIKEQIPIHQLSKIFYTDTGRILNIGDMEEGENNPVLLLKRDIHARLTERPVSDYISGDGFGDDSRRLGSQYRDEELASIRGQSSHQGNSLSSVGASHGFPKHLDPEWIALEVFDEDTEEDSSETQDDTESSDGDEEYRHEVKSRTGIKRSSLDFGLFSQIRNLSLRTKAGPAGSPQQDPAASSSDLTQSMRETQLDSTVATQDFVKRSPFGAITSSLSLIEMLIRLAGLQQFQQASHLSIPDHILTFFLEETSTTGLTGEARWKARAETKQRVGFDPFTDSLT